MKHAIPSDTLSDYGEPMTRAVETCVHCGFCLTNCPTYRVMGQEMDSPRGRIILMKEVLEGQVALEETLPHIDRCLGCLACETHCPSGVHYRDLLSPFRDRAEGRRRRSPLERIKRQMLLRTLPYPARFRWAARFGRFGKAFGPMLPVPFRSMLDLLPARLPSPRPLAGRYRPAGRPRARVALLAGCAQQVLAPEINRATVELLTRSGVEVLVPKGQECCGALAWHVGAGAEARSHARMNLRAFPFREVDAIITNAAGCGSGLREYPLILAGRREESEAEQFAAKVEDIAQFLCRLDWSPPPGPSREIVVAYHDACHLSHGQGVRAEPRRLLGSIPNIAVREVPDGEICCGSAGTYNVDQPETAAELGRRKADAVLSTGADCVVMGNIGCLTQIEMHLRRSGVSPLPEILHTVEFLAAACRGEWPGQ